MLTRDQVSALLAAMDCTIALVARLLYGMGSALRTQIEAARLMWEQDRQAQRPGVEVPHALEKKYPKVG